MNRASKSFRRSVELKEYINNVFVKGDISDIIIEPHDEPKVLLYGYVYGGRTPNAVITRKDDNLDINISKEQGESKLYSVKVKIIMPPEKIKGELAVNVDIGDIRIDGLPLKKINLKTSNGDILLGGISGYEIIANTMNGDILLRGGDYKESILTTVNGDIRIEILMTKDYRLKASTKNGKIKLVLPIESSVRISASTVKGRISVSNKEKLSEMRETEGGYILTVGEGKGEIELTALNGDISINLLKSFES